jgi:hypothetical protein
MKTSDNDQLRKKKEKNDNIVTINRAINDHLKHLDQMLTSTQF